MSHLILLRGLPGSGKTTLANVISERAYAAEAYAADEYFDIFNCGQFDADLLRDAHEWCQGCVEQSMSEGIDIVVHNTFTQQWEMDPYYKLAEKFGYVVHTVIVENRHGNKSVHNVPDETVEKMRRRFNVTL